MSTYTPSYNDDEIDLRDLIITFIDNWKIIAASTLLSVASAFIFLMITTPSFTTELEYTYARDGLRSLNTVPGIHYSEDSVTSELSQRLSAYENFLRYIQEDENAKNILLLATNINEEEFESSARSIFGEKLFFSQPTEKDQIGALRFKHINPYYGAEFLNSYYHWSQREYRIILENRAERAITSTITQNERQMRAMIEAYQESTRSFVLRQNEADQVRLLQLYDRLEAEKNALIAKREERIRLLSQAEQIAEQLGILQPTTPRELGRQQGERDVIYAEINSQNGLPLYFMGTEALRTERQVIEQNLYEEVKTAEIREIEKEISSLQNNREIEAILAREEESPFIDTYNRLKEENLLLRSNSVSADEIQVAEVVRWAYQPTKPDSPKKSLMLVLAVVAGFMIGIFMVVISGFAKTIKKRRQIAI